MTQPPIPPETPRHVGAPTDHEIVYFEGSPSLKSQIGTLFLYGVIALVVVVGSFWAAISYGGKVWFVALASLIVAAALFLIPILITRTTRYKVTNYRIDFEHGVLSKTIDTLELWHVEDPSFHQSLAERILGVGTFTIISNDPTTPKLVMKGLPNPRPLFETLKQRIISVKKARGVLKLDT